MFPQSELDNYKLQVELLQEKLKRSEISRQQLEHKLDKILQKRDEHDKMARSKARQKYQQFLEEQQRRNDRNKQLIQMLERIEQQTEVMNARSERLKMMKLQYEMYFAKLVHSQTIRCIQDSVKPVTQTMSTPQAQPLQLPSATLVEPTLEGHYYNFETPPTASLPYPYHQHSTSAYFERESFVRSQSMKTVEVPTMTDFDRLSKIDSKDYKCLNASPIAQQPQEANEKYQPKYEQNNNNIDIPTNIETTDTNISYPKNNTSIPLSSGTNLLPNKQVTESKENSNLSTTTSSTFADMPNLKMMKREIHNLSEIPNATTTITTTPDNLNNNSYIQPLHKTLNGNALKYLNQNDKSNLETTEQNTNIANRIPPEVRNKIKRVSTQNELKTHDTTLPKLHNNPLTSLKLETSKTTLESSPKSSQDTMHLNRETLQADQIENERSEKNTESNSSPTPVSIENIENEIYGELLLPLEKEAVQKPEASVVVPKLLENLVTQSESVEIVNVPTEEPVEDEYQKELNRNAIKDSTVTDPTNSVTNNYEGAEAYNDYNNSQQPEKLGNNFSDYTNYENVDTAAISEDQQQQQQEYNYSNYDPTQYSYPGYIYDEITGEYKPDPNIPAEQYATDQQYNSESYDQQYQQEGYDYNQPYTVPVTSATKRTSYNNYDTQEQDVPSGNNEEKQQTITEIEDIAPKSDLATEEKPPSSKVIKPTSILSTAEKNDAQKKKKRVNFIDSSETDESASAVKVPLSTANSTTQNLSASDSDFDFVSSTEAEAKVT